MTPITGNQDEAILKVLDALRNSRTTVDMHVVHRAINCLAVFLLTPRIRHFLEDNDPMALKHALSTILEVRI